MLYMEKDEEYVIIPDKEFVYYTVFDKEGEELIFGNEPSMTIFKAPYTGYCYISLCTSLYGSSVNVKLKVNKLCENHTPNEYYCCSECGYYLGASKYAYQEMDRSDYIVYDSVNNKSYLYIAHSKNGLRTNEDNYLDVCFNLPDGDVKILGCYGYDGTVYDEIYYCNSYTDPIAHYVAEGHYCIFMPNQTYQSGWYIFYFVLEIPNDKTNIGVYVNTYQVD